MNPRDLLILTGPPGAGKERYAENRVDGTVFSSDRGNKAQWRDHKSGALTILITAAPARAAKEYWLREAIKFGFSPRLVVVDPGRAKAADQLLAREHAKPEGSRRRLAKSVQRWYKNYSRHPAEHQVQG